MYVDMAIYCFMIQSYYKVVHIYNVIAKAKNDDTVHIVVIWWYQGLDVLATSRQKR